MYTQTMSPERDLVFNIRLDAEDRELLDACAKSEKLSRAEVVRYAVREFAQRVGVSKLSASQRHRWRGEFFSVKELAEIAGRSESTIRARLAKRIDPVDGKRAK